MKRCRLGKMLRGQPEKKGKKYFLTNTNRPNFHEFFLHISHLIRVNSVD